MRYIAYFILLYILLPLNIYIDLITILIFFISYKENYYFALIFAFFSGLLLDLYHPALLGGNALVYVVLAQTLLYAKKYLAQSMLVVLLLLVVFYLTRLVAVHILLLSPISIIPLVLTILLSAPVFVILNRLLHGVWTKI